MSFNWTYEGVVKIENAAYEYAKLKYKHIVKCLSADNLLEELCFVNMIIDSCIRLNEAKLLTWEQVDFNEHLLKDVKISKDNKDGLKSYGDIQISLHTIKLLKKFKKLSNADRIFSKHPYLYTKNIRESIGDNCFNGHELRSFGFIFKISMERSSNG